jgi:hypothetical protein
MKRISALLFLFASWSLAQTTVYLRSSGPAAAVISNATNATPAQITAASHGFSAACGSGTTCYCIVAGMCSGSGASSANGIRECKYIDANTLALYDLTGTAIAGNGAYCTGYNASTNWGGGGQWVGQVTPYTLGTGPLGLLDGLTGPRFQALSLGTSNGLAASGGLVASGCPSACVFTMTFTSSFNPLTALIPVAAGNNVAIWGTTSSAINQQGTSTKGTSYTVASVTSSSIATTPVALSGVSNGDYTTNAACGPASTPNGTIGGTQNCVRISFTAFPGNPFWDGMTTYSSACSLDSSPGYKFLVDGGSNPPHNSGSDIFQCLEIAGARFFVDQSNSQLLTDIAYYLNNLPKFAGGNFIANEQFENGGNNDLPYGPEEAVYFALAVGYQAGAAYISGKSTLLNQTWNNLDDPTVTACSKADGEANTPTPTSHNIVLATGSAQGGTSTSITLAASDIHAAGYYVNNVVQAGGNYCLVTAYNNTTKVATCSSSWSAPASGEAYTIFATVTISSVAGSGTATITGYNTHFSSSAQVNVGDSLLASNGWSAYIDGAMAWVTAVNSDTSLTVLTSSHVNATGWSTSTPAMVWDFPVWKTGDCGLNWLMEHNPGQLGPQPILYGANGAGNTLNSNVSPNFIQPGSNYMIGQENGHMIWGLAMAPDDARAAKDFTTAQSANFDFELSHYMNYGTAFAHSGSFYSSEVKQEIGHFAWMLQNSFPTFPAIDTAWIANTPLFDIYDLYPDIQNGAGVSARWGTQTGAGTNTLNARGTMAYFYPLDPMFMFAPMSTNAAYLRNWLTNVQSNSSLWGFNGVSGDPLGLFYDDPRIGSTTWTGQPHQHLFQASSASACASLTGWPCPAAFRGDAIISLTGWTKTDALLLYESRTWYGDHDIPSNGMLSLYRVGEILGPDSPSAPSGAGIENDDNTTIGDMLQFGGTNTTVSGYNFNSPGMTPITSWASSNHGAWSTAYGDQASNYTYVCSNLSGAYTTAITYAQRCIAHLKPSGGEQIVVQWDSVKVPTPVAMATHVHYPQNGETSWDSYPDGHTTCPGTGGCASLNTSRAIQELEDGGNDGVNPTRNYGVLTHFLSPGTVTVNWDCPGNAECSTSSTYTGGNGHTDRVSVCGGSSCGSAVSTFESLIVHKVITSLTDTTLTTAALNPDANWTGVQTLDKVVLMARGGTAQSAITGFTTTHAGTALYLFGGLTPGTYTITVGGTAVAGSPFTVAANDNSIEFSSLAGAVSVNGSVGSGSGSGSGTSAAASSIVSGHAAVSGNAIVH